MDELTLAAVNALMLTIYRLTGFALVPAYTKTTSLVRLAYSGFRLRTALFFNPHVRTALFFNPHVQVS